MAMDFQVGVGKHQINVTAIKTNNGITICLTGGDSPHVGAVALGIPRPSLSDKDKTSVSTSVLTLTGHKDDEIAKPAADRLARELNEPVVVVAGIHVGPHNAYTATPEDISQVIENCQRAIQELIRRLRAPD